jgi:hypothetical protein
MTFAILMGIRMFGSLRVSDEAEYDGLDVSSHSESAYSFGSGGSMPVSASHAPGLATTVAAHERA